MPGRCAPALLRRRRDLDDSRFDDAVSGFAAGTTALYADASDVYASSDEFATSTTVPLGWPASVGLYADGATLFAYGGLRDAELRRSSDGGQTWASVFSAAYGSQSSATSGVARGSAALFALANGCSVPSCTGALIRSDDDGATWAEASRPQANVAGVWAASDSEVFVGGTALALGRRWRDLHRGDAARRHVHHGPMGRERERALRRRDRRRGNPPRQALEGIDAF